MTDPCTCGPCQSIGRITRPRCAVFFPARCHLCPIQAPCERLQRSPARTFEELAQARERFVEEVEG